MSKNLASQSATRSNGWTSGPWTVERVDYDLHGLDASFEVNAGFKTVVQTHMREIKRESEWLAEDEANCHLIAAAPCLYEALDRLHSAVGRNVNVHLAALAAVKALSRARGEA
jgi:predicted metal-dependent phosphoesterase TrpH